MVREGTYRLVLLFAYLVTVKGSRKTILGSFKVNLEIQFKGRIDTNTLVKFIISSLLSMSLDGIEYLKRFGIIVMRQQA